MQLCKGTVAGWRAWCVGGVELGLAFEAEGVKGREGWQGRQFFIPPGNTLELPP